MRVGESVRRGEGVRGGEMEGEYNGDGKGEEIGCEEGEGRRDEWEGVEVDA